MTFTKSLLLGLAVISLSACSSTPSFTNPSDVLLAGIDTAALPSVAGAVGAPSLGSVPGLPSVGSLPGVPGGPGVPGVPGVGSLPGVPSVPAIPTIASALGEGFPTSGVLPTLSASNPTCLTFYENTAKFAALPANPTVPTGPSFGGSLMKTLVLGTLSGLASGGIGAIGIDNSFANAALIGTASQVTYNTGSTMYDKIVGTGIPDVPAAAVPELSPLQEIQKAAATLGCPAPDRAAIAALPIGQ